MNLLICYLFQYTIVVDLIWEGSYFLLLYANKKIFAMHEKFVFDLVKNLEGIKKKN